MTDQIQDNGPSAGIGAAGDVAARLVEEKVRARRRRPERPTVQRDAITLGIRLRARLGADLPVDGDPARGEERFSPAA